MDRKKELKQQYKQAQRPMGVFAVRSKVENRCYVEAALELKGTMNSTTFKLRLGSHPNQGLQAAWNAEGESNFTVEVLETLECDGAAPKTDYSEDLALLCMMWEERLAGENMTFYEK